MPSWKVEQSTPPPGQLAGQSGVVHPLQRQRGAPPSALEQKQVVSEDKPYSQGKLEAGQPAQDPVGCAAGQTAFLQFQAGPSCTTSQEQTVVGGYLQPPKLVIVVIVVSVHVLVCRR